MPEAKEEVVKGLQEMNLLRDKLFESFRTCTEIEEGKSLPAAIVQGPHLVDGIYKNVSNMLKMIYGGNDTVLSTYFDKEKSGSLTTYKIKKGAPEFLKSVLDHLYVAREAEKALEHMYKVLTIEAETKKKEAVESLDSQIKAYKTSKEVMQKGRKGLSNLFPS